MVKWSLPAKHDLKTIHDFIATDSKHYAKKVVKEVLTKSETLNEFPLSGRTVPEIGNHNIREVFIYSYRLIYQIRDTDVVVLALLHSRREFPEDKF